MEISQVFRPTPSKLLTLCTKANELLVNCRLRKSRSTITIGSFGLLIFFLVQKMFHVKMFHVNHPISRMLRKEMLLMLQQIFQFLLQFMTDFITNHPRISCSIFGVLGALFLIAFVVAINLIC